jgi:predicted PhzF superfamily epimerase YddE/YHI9
VVITSISDDANFDYFLRSFCPWIGIDEDPVTGSVHSVLGNFWKQRLHRQNMNAYQASARGGELLIRAFDDRVEIGGEAVVILTGEMAV